jgi:hypothetical protein
LFLFFWGIFSLLFDSRFNVKIHVLINDVVLCFVLFWNWIVHAKSSCKRGETWESRRRGQTRCWFNPNCF